MEVSKMLREKLHLMVRIARLRLRGLTYREINAELGIPDGGTCRLMNSPLGKFVTMWVA